MPLSYTYDESQVRRFPEVQTAIQQVDDFITKLDVWSSRKLKELNRSEKE